MFVNGKKVGTHTGGYDAFSLNITDYLKSGENVLVVGAYDPNDGRAASGKNGSRGDYIFTSGIWQTVWVPTFLPLTNTDEIRSTAPKFNNTFLPFHA